MKLIKWRKFARNYLNDGPHKEKNLHWAEWREIYLHLVSKLTEQKQALGSRDARESWTDHSLRLSPVCVFITQRVPLLKYFFPRWLYAFVRLHMHAKLYMLIFNLGRLQILQDQELHYFAWNPAKQVGKTLYYQLKQRIQRWYMTLVDSFSGSTSLPQGHDLLLRLPWFLPWQLQDGCWGSRLQRQRLKPKRKYLYFCSFVKWGLQRSFSTAWLQAKSPFSFQDESRNVQKHL